VPSDDSALQLGDASVEVTDKLDQFAKEWLEQSRELVLRVADRLLDRLHDRMDAFADHKPELAENPSDLIGLRRVNPGPGPHEPGAGPG
jgi:hypothetical protein